MKEDEGEAVLHCEMCPSGSTDSNGATMNLKVNEKNSCNSVLFCLLRSDAAFPRFSYHLLLLLHILLLLPLRGSHSDSGAEPAFLATCLFRLLLLSRPTHSSRSPSAHEISSALFLSCSIACPNKMCFRLKKKTMKTKTNLQKYLCLSRSFAFSSRLCWRFCCMHRFWHFLLLLFLHHHLLHCC